MDKHRASKNYIELQYLTEGGTYPQLPTQPKHFGKEKSKFEPQEKKSSV